MVDTKGLKKNPLFWQHFITILSRKGWGSCISILPR